MMWNNVLANFISLKRRFIHEFGEDAMWEYGEYKNCVEYWSSKFDDFFEMFSPLIITEYNDFVLLRYNLLDTDVEFWSKYDEMYRECRSVVLDKKREELVLVPFRKFFNVNEMEETSEKNVRAMIANAKRVEISDKMDGSMQSVRYYDNRIVLAGTRALDPNQSFRVTIGYSLLDSNYHAMLMDNPDYTFIFELICKEDQHVVVYSEEQRGLYLIGMRNVLTGNELTYDEVIATARQYGVRHTNVFDKTFDQVIKSLNEKSSDEAEGFVINIDGYKVKLKYNDYIKIHHMLSKMVSTNTIIKCVEDDSWDDVRCKMPEAYRADADIVANDVKAYIKMMNAKIDKMFKDVVRNYEKSDDERIDRKNFAMYVNKHHKKESGYLIAKYSGNENNFIRNKAGRYLRYHEIKEKLVRNTD